MSHATFVAAVGQTLKPKATIVLRECEARKNHNGSLYSPQIRTNKFATFIKLNPNL